MTGEDIFLALSDIDDDLIAAPYVKRKPKRLALCIAAVFAAATLCAAALLAEFRVTWDTDRLTLEIINASGESDYEEWTLGYLAEGYEISQDENGMWLVGNGKVGFLLMQAGTTEVIQWTTETVNGEYIPDELIDSVLVLDNLADLTTTDLQLYSTVYWISENSAYNIILVGKPEKEVDDLIAMIKSITP